MSDRDDETGEAGCSCGDFVYIEKPCMCEEIIALRSRVEELEEECVAHIVVIAERNTSIGKLRSALERSAPDVLDELEATDE